MSVANTGTGALLPPEVAPSRPVHQRRPGLTVETVVDYFYGFVAAK